MNSQGRPDEENSMDAMEARRQADQRAARNLVNNVFGQGDRGNANLNARQPGNAGPNAPPPAAAAPRNMPTAEEMRAQAERDRQAQLAMMAGLEQQSAADSRRDARQRARNEARIEDALFVEEQRRARR
jgi:hypothetical protein